MKFRQLIVHNKRNLFFQKSFTKYGGETSPNQFFKNSKFNVSLDRHFEVLYGLFLLQVQECLFDFTSYKAFLKNKKGSGTSLTASFST